MVDPSHLLHRSIGYRITNLVTQKNSRDSYCLEVEVNMESSFTFAGVERKPPNGEPLGLNQEEAQ